jgi:hypothetical protein
LDPASHGYTFVLLEVEAIEKVEIRLGNIDPFLALVEAEVVEVNYFLRNN